MICGYCGKEIAEEVPAEGKSCGSCPGGCRKIHCPHCGYGNPAPSGLLRRWLNRDDDKKEGPK